MDEIKVSSKERFKIAKDMLLRYSGCSERDIGKYILLTNFTKYLDVFSQGIAVKVKEGSLLKVAIDKKNDITMIQFNIGAPSAALVVDLLSSIFPRAVLMLGLCGGLHKSLKIGEFILPLAAIRNEGVSKHYMPPEVPSLPTFKIQSILANTLKNKKSPYKTGVIHTTDYRFWEFDKKFRDELKLQKAIAIEMECSALFTTAFKMKVPIGALLLVSDLPLTIEGIKTYALQQKVFKTHVSSHIALGLEAMDNIKKFGQDIDLRHFQW
ncbi:AMP nucleosidase [Candidatus Omnitrophota bacterium]